MNTRRDVGVKKLEKASRVLKCIAHPVRLRILELLQGDKSLTVTEMMLTIGIEQSLLSHHLTKMRDQDVLTSVREGKNIRYHLTDNQITSIFDCIESCSFM